MKEDITSETKRITYSNYMYAHGQTLVNTKMFSKLLGTCNASCFDY